MGPARAAEQFRRRHPDAARFTVQLRGSLAATGRGHLTDRILLEILGAERTTLDFRPDEPLPRHPNGLIFDATDRDGRALATWTVYSVGGGALRDEDDLGRARARASTP